MSKMQHEINIGVHTKNLSILNDIQKSVSSIEHNRGNSKLDNALEDFNNKLQHIKSLINNDLKNDLFEKFMYENRKSVI